MPRRKPRFSDLERQFRSSGGQAAPNSDLDYYIRFKRGETRINISNPIPSSERKRYAWGILPFNKPVPGTITDSDYYAATISQYSERGRRGLEATNTTWGYHELTQGTVRDDNFYPALIRCFEANAGAVAAPQISQITHRSYKRLPGKSYSIPFGRAGGTVGTDTEEVRRQAITTTLKQNARIKSVSYDPEVFKIGSPDPGAAPANLPSI